jgi:hypothetical protein
MRLMGQRTLQRSMASDSPASDDGRLTQALAHAPHGAVPTLVRIPAVCP